jgi:hypothetical protein
VEELLPTPSHGRPSNTSWPVVDWVDDKVVSSALPWTISLVRPALGSQATCTPEALACPSRVLTTTQ